MKPVALSMGIVLVIMGIMGYVTMQDFMKDCQSSADNGGLLAGYIKEMCGQLQLMQYGLTAGAVVGLGITIYGGVSKKKIVETPTSSVHREPSFTTSDVLRIVKSLEDIKEKHNELEKKYAMLTSYLKRIDIEIPDFILKNKQ